MDKYDIQWARDLVKNGARHWDTVTEIAKKIAEGRTGLQIPPMPIENPTWIIDLTQAQGFKFPEIDVWAKADRVAKINKVVTASVEHLRDNEKLPQSIILNAADDMRAFDRAVKDLGLRHSDYYTLVRQILDLVLEFGSTADQSFPRLPDYSQLVDPSIANDPAQATVLRASVQALAYQLFSRVAALNTFREPPPQQRQYKVNEFPYYFRGFYRHDIVLDYMPF